VCMCLCVVWLSVSLHPFVCVYASCCVSVCLCVCMRDFVCLWDCVCLWGCVCLFMIVTVCVCLYLSAFVRVCLYVCVSVCLYGVVDCLQAPRPSKSLFSSYITMTVACTTVFFLMLSLFQALIVLATVCVDSLGPPPFHRGTMFLVNRCDH